MKSSETSIISVLTPPSHLIPYLVLPLGTKVLLNKLPTHISLSPNIFREQKLRELVRGGVKKQIFKMGFWIWVPCQLVNTGKSITRSKGSPNSPKHVIAGIVTVLLVENWDRMLVSGNRPAGQYLNYCWDLGKTIITRAMEADVMKCWRCNYKFKAKCKTWRVSLTAYRLFIFCSLKTENN